MGGRENARIAFVSLGCAKNLVNSEQMMFLLSEAGFIVRGETHGADVVVVNTCSFIESAKTEAIETILELARDKADGRVGKIIAAGCLPERYKNEIMREMPEIDAIVGVGGFDDIVGVVASVLEGKTGLQSFGDINAPVSETQRIITTSKAWAYIKIAEGCDNRCAFCAIPDIRGRFRSRPIERIVTEVDELAQRGLKEAILVAQDVTRYGLDMYGKRRLSDLLSELCKVEGLEWIRLHYLYPDEFDEELIETIAINDKILKYLDIPIQHINDEILKRMHRRGTGREIRALFKLLRERIPGVVLRTSVITGLPGEGEAEFEELCEFLTDAKIERTGVFPYSPEEGTAAALMQFPDSEIAVRRAEIIMNIQLGIADEFNRSRIGSVTPVLPESFSEGQFYGRSYAESPDVDGYISIKGEGISQDAIVNVRITGIEEGEVVQ